MTARWSGGRLASAGGRSRVWRLHALARIRSVHRLRSVGRLLVVVLLVVGCGGAPILANPPAEHGAPLPSATAQTRLPDPQPVVLPRDDGPHRRLTEWWYYTGHLQAADGRRFGFEDVIFRAERGAFPVTWASHLALTDEQGQRFLYDQRTEIGPQVDASPRGPDGAPTGFALALTGFDPSRSAPPAGSPWTMAGAAGTDRLAATSTAGRLGNGAAPPFGLALALTTSRPAVLHDTIGYVGFGEAGGSYYYSRPRMAATGQVTIGSETFAVTGDAWFDHQWGDFISVGGGGWDWFAVTLADGTDLTLSLVRDASGAYPLVYGTLVHPDGTFEHLGADAFSVDVTGAWTSPTTGARYPSGWRVQVPKQGLDMKLVPTLPDQELDTRPTTGVVYWEGSQRVLATHNGSPIGGEAYVELTGYGPTATGARGSAAPGSAAPGSAAASAAPRSAVPGSAAAGSPATGSAATGSAAPGSTAASTP